jgi:tetratricopeptide (TPR) repeat protein
MTLDKLKVAARQHEQKEEWRSAIDLYREAIRSTQGGVDPSLFNRVGDLEQKAGDHRAAIEAWEQAATRYGEQGFFNNAIALCGKILRLDPGRIRTYLELARFQARKRVIYDVRQNLTIYREQMAQRGQEEEADEALLAFEGKFSSWLDLRSFLDELLGRDPGEDATETAGSSASAPPGDLVFLDMNDAGALEIERASEPNLSEPNPSPTTDDGAGLVIEPTTMEIDMGGVGAGDGVLGLEPTTMEGAEADDAPDVAGMVEFERTAEAVGSPPAPEGLQETETAGSVDEVITMDGLESTAMATPEVTVVPTAQADPGAGGLVFIDVDAAGEPGEVDVPSSVPVSAEAITLEGADPLGSRAAGHERLDEGDRAGAIAKLEEALAGYQEQEEWGKAWQVMTELIEADPLAIDRYQHRVELAVRLSDREKLASSYFDLGEALIAEGSTEKAVAVFRRLLEIDEHHAAGRAALRRMAPESRPEETAEGFVDFGAMVIDDVGPRSTRMRTETTTISDDEDETFREALEEFKRALDQNVSAEDYQTHYDLGLAFKEMGLLEEAITAFQKALRSPEGHLRTSEALGQCFFEQDRPAVAEAVLRAVEKGGEADAEKIGVLYWLGRALEAQKKTKQALSYYERVLAVDVTFQDASDRVTGLAK